MDKMTPTDQNPPPHTMSDKSDKEISREILARGVAAQICLMTPATFDKIYDTALTAIDQSTAAMRDELERVKLAAYAGRCGLDLSEKIIASKDSEIADLRTGLSVKMVSLESQAGAMRAFIEPIPCSSRCFQDTQSAFETKQRILSGQAGADLLKRVQALEADKKRLDWALLNLEKFSRLWYCGAQNEGELVSMRSDLDAALSQEQATPRTG